MPRATRSTEPLDDNFQIPDFSRGRIVQMSVTGTGAATVAGTGAGVINAPGAGGGSVAAAPVIAAAPIAAAPNIIWQETLDHGNYNPGTKIGQSIFK